MKNLFLAVLLLFTANTLLSQVQLKSIERSQEKLMIPLTSVPISLTPGDTTWHQVYHDLEVRNDSLCVLDNDCLVQLGVDANCYQIILDKGNFDGIGSNCDTIFFNKRPNGATTYSIGNFENDQDTIFNSVFIDLGEGLVYLSGDGTESAPFEFSLDLILNDSETIDFTQQQTAIFTGEVDTTIIATQYDISQIQDTDTQLTDEEVEDIVGEMVTGNNEYLVTVVYNDNSGKMNFLIEDDLNQYDNSNSNFITSPNDADSDPTNELFDSAYIYQALVDTAENIRNDFPEGFSGLYNDLDFTGTTGLSDGIDNVDDLDNDPDNEKLTGVFVSGDNINFNENGAILSVDKSIFGDGNGFWSQNGSDVYYNSGNVGIGTSSPVYDLDISGIPRFEEGGNLFITGGNTTAIGGSNVALGSNSSVNLTTGQRNTSIGVGSMQFTTTGQDNFGLGQNALQNNISGSNNVAVGRRSLQSATDQGQNVAIGTLAGNSMSGGSNVAIGYYAGRSVISNNVCIGRDAGRSSGSGGVFLGYQSGYNESGSNKLYIDNSATSAPLIYGDFLTHELKINGDFESTGEIVVGDLTGAGVNILMTDGNGKLVNGNLGTNISVTSGTVNVDDNLINYNNDDSGFLVWDDVAGSIGQSLASANMNFLEYGTSDWPSYRNVAVSTENMDNGDASVNTSFERIEIDSDGGGYYMVSVQGHIYVDNDTHERLEFFVDDGLYKSIGIVWLEANTDEQSFHLSFPMLFSNNANLTLAVKPTVSPTNDINIGSCDWHVIKI